jgi:hypothetical protein
MTLGIASWSTGSLRGASRSENASPWTSLPMPRTTIAPSWKQSKQTPWEAPSSTRRRSPALQIETIANHLGAFSQVAVFLDLTLRFVEIRPQACRWRPSHVDGPSPSAFRQRLPPQTARTQGESIKTASGRATAVAPVGGTGSRRPVSSIVERTIRRSGRDLLRAKKGDNFT